MFDVSVIIPTLNRSDFLLDALRSIDEQSSELSVQVIVVDDFSCSKVELDPNLYNFNLKVLRNEKNLGGAVSRNIGIKESNSKYISFLDDDDLLINNKLKVLHDFLELNPSYTAVFGRLERMSGKVINADLPIDKVFKIEHIKHLSTNTSLIRNDAFKTTSFYSKLKKFQDTQFHIDLIKNFNVAFININVSLWRDNHEFGQITSMNTFFKRFKSCFEWLRLYKYCCLTTRLSLLEHVFFIKIAGKAFIRIFDFR